MSDLAGDILDNTQAYGDLRDSSFLPGHGESFDVPGMALTGLKVASTVAGSIPGGEMAGTIMSMVGRAVGGGLNAYDAQGTVAALKQKLSEVSNSSIPFANKKVLVECINHLLAKQGIKFKAGVSNAAVVGQPFETAYRAGKAVYKFAKGTKGKHRAESANALFELLNSPDAKTRELAGELVVIIAKQDFTSLIKKTLSNAFKS